MTASTSANHYSPHLSATISLSEGENIGWVQHMLGHSSLQMIFTKYYAWMPKETRNDGSAMMRACESVRRGKEVIVNKSKGDKACPGIFVSPFNLTEIGNKTI
jgi:hypothetical protein